MFPQLLFSVIKKLDTKFYAKLGVKVDDKYDTKYGTSSTDFSVDSCNNV
jgi:hypothetical protein